MMRHNIRHLPLYATIAINTLFSSCTDDPYRGDSKPYKSINPAEYTDFSTVFDCPINIDFDHKALIKVYDVDPVANPDAHHIYATFTDIDGKYHGEMQLPTALVGKQLWAMGQSMYSTAVVGRDGVTFKGRFSTSRAEEIPTHMYTDAELIYTCERLYDLYLKRLPEGKNNTSKLTETKNLPIYTVKNGTEIMFSFINSGGRYVSQLYYFYFPKDVDTKEFMINYVTEKAAQEGTEPDLSELGLRTAFMRFFTSDAPGTPNGCKFLLTDGWGVYYTGRDEYVPPGTNYKNKAIQPEYSTYMDNGFNFVVYDENDTEHLSPLYGNGFTDAKDSYTAEELNAAKNSNVIVPGIDSRNYKWGTWQYLGYGFINRNFNNQVGAHHHLKYYGVNYDQEGTYYFPADIRIGFILKVLNTDKYDPKKDNKSTSIHMLTTNNEMNLEGNIQCARNLSVMPSDDEKDITNIVYGFEDALIGGGNSSDKDYNDFIFMVTATPEVSTDGITEFNDNGLMEIEGTLLYEDLYPNPGDYDMNDVIVEYEMIVNFNDKNYVTSIDCKFWPINYGATYTDDFYIELRDGDNSYIEPTLIIDAATIRKMSDINLANIKSGTPPTKFVRKTFTFDTNKVKLDKDLVKITNVNPFIYVQNTQREVHLTNGRFCGVSNASQSGLTEDECKYYPLMLNNGSMLDGCYFPYAMNVPIRFTGMTFDGFTPVTETIYIVLEYQKFLIWMKDNTQATDWYRYYQKWPGGPM